MSGGALGRHVRTPGSPRVFAVLVLLLALTGAAQAAPFGNATPASAREGATARKPVPVTTGDAIVLSQAAANEFLMLGSAFDRADGQCQDSGWRAEDLTTKLYAHVTDRTLVNADHALWEFGGSAALPAAADQFALGYTTAVARTDSGGVRILQFASNNFGTERWVQAYPGLNTVRELEVTGTLPGNATLDFRVKADLDPVTHGTIASDGNHQFLFLISADGTTRSTLLGGGTVDGDGPADQARIRTTTFTVAANGDVYFADQLPSLTLLDTRLRMLRRSDMQVLTLATPPSAPAEGPFGTALLGELRGIAVAPNGDLFLNDNGYIRRANLQTNTITTLSGLIATDGLEYSGGVLYFSHTGFEDNEGFDGPRVIMKFNPSDNTAVVVAGSEAFGGFALGGTATANLGTQNPFPSFGERFFGFDADGAGGLYFAAGGAAFHLFADGRMERLVGRTRSMRMGTHAVCFGADSASSPEVARDWVEGSGWGNNWSQRLLLPTYDGVAHPSAVLDFDVALFTGGDGPALTPPFNGNAFVVQAELADGTWSTLAVRLGLGSGGITTQGFRDSTVYQHVWCGSGLFHARVLMAEQPFFQPLATPARLRIVVNTNATGSAEDGFGPQVPAAAIVDNIVISEAGQAIAAADFENGTLQGCQLVAQNHRNTIALDNFVIIHDEPALSAPRVVSAFDSNLPSCLWTFTQPGGLMGNYALSRLESPWIAVPRRDTSMTFEFRGKLPSLNDWRVVTPWVRVKWAGDSRPRAFGSGLLSLTNGQVGTDATAPVSVARVAYPADFQFPLVTRNQPVGRDPLIRGFDPTSGVDSVQIVWQVEDRVDELGDTNDRSPSKLPIIDELRVYQLNADADLDGIADRTDVCSSTSAAGLPGTAAGQDADGDGCIDPTSTMQHAESWSAEQYPIHYTFNAAGDPSNPTGESLPALRNAFAVWGSVPGAQLPFQEDAPTTLTRASATDGINLVTFQDPDFDFSDGAIAITPTLSFDRRVSFHDRIVLPGEIVDADIVFNPAFAYGTPRHPGAIDLAGVAQHEIGHLLGLSHSGGRDATMYFVLQPGAAAATLTADDEAAVASAYPSGSFATSFGTITGRITRGSDGSAIPGALVRAFRLDAAGAPLASAATDYSREDGSYALRRLAPGRYGVHVTPLDGDVDGNPLEPAVINAHVAGIAQTNFQEEWRSDPETSSDDGTLILPVIVAAGLTIANADVITNIDSTPPQITTSFPVDGALDVRVDSAMLLKFSEPVDGAALGRSFKLRRNGVNIAGGGTNAFTNAGRTFMLTPPQTLDFDADYQLEVTTDLTDREGVHLAQLFRATFHTEAQPAIAIIDIQPRAATPGTFVTLKGAGFDVSGLMSAVFERTLGGVDSVNASQITPTSAVVKIPLGPPGALTGDVRMVVVDRPNNRFESSNAFRIALRESDPPANAVLLSSTSLPFIPSDVVVSPDGLSAIAVGPDAMATVVYGAPPATAATLVPRPLAGGRHVVMSADGLRAFVSRPDAQDVVELDANPASGTYGAVTRTLFVGTKTDALALSASGRLLYVTLPDSASFAVLDVDPLSNTVGEIRALLSTPGQTLIGGMALAKDGTTLAYTTEQGSVAALLAANGLAISRFDAILPSSPSQGAVVASESDDAFLYALRDGTLQVARHVNANGNIFSDPHRPQSVVPLGGDVSDLAVVPFRRALLATNRSLNLLQVVTLDSTNQTTYLTKLTDVPTNLGPAAVSTDGLGATAVVACAVSRTLERFTFTRGRSLNVLANSMAIPGDMIAITTDLASQTLNSRVAVGGTLVPFLNINDVGSGGAFLVPAAAPRGDVGIAVSSPGDTARTFSRPLRIFDAVPGGLARSAGLQGRTDVFSGCVGFPPGTAYLASGMRISPDGRTLAVLAYGPLHCRAMVDLYQIANEGPERFSAQLARLMFNSDVRTLDFDFSADSRQLYVTDSENQFRAYDVDPASPTYGFTLGVQFAPAFQPPYGLAVDPMGRQVWLAGRNGPGDPLTGLSPTAPYAPTAFTAQPAALHALVPSRDGKWLLGGGDGQALLFSLEPPQIANITLQHPGTGFVEHFAVTGDGRRAVALFANGQYAVISLEQAFAGTELFFGQLPGGFPAFDATIGPSPSTVIVSTGTGVGRDAFLLDLTGTTPIVTSLGITNGLGYVAMTPDHRSLWTMDETLETSRLVLHEFTAASTMKVLSGADQTAAPGTSFPSPVRVLVTDAQGIPQTGVLVRFSALDGRGSLDADTRVPLRDISKLTDANGEAAVVWRAEVTSAGPQSLLATVPVLGATSDVVLGANGVGADADTPPVVTAIGPADGATGVLANSELFVQFNQAMNLGTLTDAFTFIVDGTPVSGTLRGELGGRLVFWKPQTPLPFLADCVFSLAPGPLDTDGQALTTGAGTSFSAAGLPALQVTAIAPPAAAVGTPVTLSGSGFNPAGASNAVVLEGVIAPIVSASASALVIRVPAGAVSGNLSVQTGGSASAPFPFTVLAPDTVLGAVIADLPSQGGVQSIAITPDGERAYAANSRTNTVQALDLRRGTTITNIIVGVQPVMLAILPSGQRAYVVNRGSDDVSVVDTDPNSPTYHSELKRIAVGKQPVALSIARDGSYVAVACKGDSMVFVIDSQPGSAAYDRVTKSASVAAGSQSIAVSADGTRIFIGTGAGVSVLDLRSGEVTKSASVAAGSQSIAVSADGAFLFVLSGDSHLLVIDVTPGSTNQNKVVKSASVAAGSQSIAVSADGAKLFITDPNGRVLVYAIQISGAGAPVLLVPGASISITLQHEFTAGQGASGIGVDPRDGFILVTNTIAGTITEIGLPGALAPITMGFDFKPDKLNLRSHGRFVEAELFPPAPYTAKDVDIASVRIEGVVPVSKVLGSHSPDDEDDDEHGRARLRLKFDRLAIQTLLLPGERVPIHVTGLVAGRPFAGADTVRVVRGRVRSPHDHDQLTPGATHLVAWDSPEGENVMFVNLVVTFDEGGSWRTLASHVPNSGQWAWAVPDTLADSVRVCVLLAEGDEDGSGYAPGMVATSEPFRIMRTTDAPREVPGQLSLARPSPNPARRGTAMMRFGLPVAGDVQLELYDLMGRRVKTLVDGRREAGWHDVRWRGELNGGLARPGLYYVRLRHGGRELRQPLIWLE